ncbi:DUF4910 domain-containing protein [Pelagibacterales bacterium SAG-MED38]|nr:DUF4910 domain-containing protein [Pelagibacterales bacterium SAG-MED38]
MKIINIIKKLFPFDYSIVSDDSIKAVKEFKKLLPFKVYSYKTGLTHNGWKIPKSWKLKKGLIKDGKKIIFDAKNKRFGVSIMSKSFKGKVNSEELKMRINVSKIKNATPYDWTGLYRPKDKWGFSMNHNEFRKIKKNKYNVEIETKVKKSKMKVLEYTLNGKNKETIIINAHNCHPFQANDDISGCALGIKLFDQLKKIKKRKFTYTLLIAPELYGPIFWLKNLNKKKLQNLKYAILLKSLGNKNIIKLQHSVKKYSEIDNIALRQLKNSKEKFLTGNFRTVYGNDEIVFDSPGYDISSITLTRVPFKEYHTDLDTPKNLSEKTLLKSYSILNKIINEFENKTRFKNNYKGVIALSSSKFNLYKNAEAPGLDKKKYESKNKNWNLLMNNLPSFLENNMSIEEIAKYYKLPFQEVFLYCQKWEKKGLITRY